MCPVPTFALALVFVVISMLPSGDIQAEQPRATDPALLTLDRLYRDGEFNERGIGLFKWSQRRPSTYFKVEASQAGTQGQDLVRYDLETGVREIVVPAAALVPKQTREPLVIESFTLSNDESRLLIYTQSKRVWRLNTRGDYWVLDLGAPESLRKLGGESAPSSLMFAKFSPDGTKVAYVRENNVEVQDLESLQITPVTTDGSSTLINGTSDWVNEEELQIRDAFRWSPDGQSILFWQFDTSGVKQFQLINNTDQSYPQLTTFPYPKVGETNSATRLGVAALSGSRTLWIELPGDPREHYLPHAEWSPTGTHVIVQQLNRLQNQNRVFMVDAITGKSNLVLTETDDAWLENENPVRWLAGGKRFLWLSERSGWRQAYLADSEGAELTPITRESFDVIQVDAIDEEDGWLYFSASPDNATQHYLYRLSLAGGTAERLSPISQPGWHSYDFSSDCRYALHTYSTLTTPTKIELVRMPSHEVVSTLEDNQSLRDKLAMLDAPATEMMKLDIGDGVVLDAWCLKPAKVRAGTKSPLLIHVYGEPASQSVRDKWPGDKGLWHWMLAQQGYIVACIENRGTPVPRGREWRKAAFRQIGILAVQDQAAGVKALLQQLPSADPGRIGSWGWSGGGSMSLNAIFRYPEIYSTAIAVASNPDQLMYDNIYQERYMGLPQDNAENYRLGSPITYASQLQGNLLIVHGTGDDNCHYQGAERLINELIKHNKRFDAMPYPNRSHSISEGANTVRHLYGTMTRYLHEHLPVNPVRVVFETELGSIQMDVEVARAPVSAANFLRYVDGGFYNGGLVNRAVRPDNTIRHDVEIQVIQFQPDPSRAEEMFPPIELERTNITGLRNVDGALSMARLTPDSGQASFSIVIGDQPEMDYRGRRNPDGQGFAVFGRVVGGWQVVKAIHQSPTGKDGEYKTETLEPPIKIIRAYRQ